MYGLGDVIHAARKRHGLTQQAFGAIFNVSPMGVHYWERKECRQPPHIIAWCDASPPWNPDIMLIHDARRVIDTIQNRILDSTIMQNMRCDAAWLAEYVVSAETLALARYHGRGDGAEREAAIGMIFQGMATIRSETLPLAYIRLAQRGASGK